MRNLKKVLSLALALVMLLGMMVVGAGAASFKDADKIENTEAVDVVSGIGVLLGDENGNFNPEGTLSRAEAAVVIAKLDLGAAFGNLETTNASTFSDVPAGYWGKPYIDYCFARGLIAGVGNNKYNPNGKVTGVEFALMVSRVLGYEDKAEQVGGADWEVDAAALARKAGLTVDVTLGSLPMTRDEMAQVTYNALKANMVEYKNGTINIDVGGTPVTIGGNPATPKANSKAHYDASVKQDNILQLCEEKFPQLTVRADEDAFARPVNVWTYKREDIAEVPAAAMAEYHTSTKGATIKSDLKVNDSVEVEYYLDGKLDPAIDTVGKLRLNNGNTRYIGANGVLTQAWYDEAKDIVTVTVINTYVGRVSAINRATSSAKRSVSISQFNGFDVPNLGANLNAKFETEDFAAKDVVLYTAAYNGTKYDIQTMDALGDPVTGKLTKWNGTTVTDDNSTGKAESSFAVDGETHKYDKNVVVVDDTATQIAGVWGFTVNESEVNVYTDKYGYAIYVSGVEGETNYAAVIGVGGNNPYGNATTGVTLLMPDGTIKTVTATVKNLKNSNDTGNATALSLKNAPTNTGTDPQLVSDAVGDLVSYRVRDNDVYELTILGYSNPSTSTTGTYTGKYNNTNINHKSTGSTDGDRSFFTNGKSAIRLGGSAYYVTSDTLFFVCTGSGTNKSYNVYKGYSEMPTFGTDATDDLTGYAYFKNSEYTTQLDAVYIAADALGGTSAVDTYFVKKAKAEIITDSTGSYYVLPAIVDGEVTEIKLDATGTIAGTNWTDNANVSGVFAIKNVVKDKNDIIINFADASSAFNATASGYKTGTVGTRRGVLGLGANGSVTAADYWAYTSNTNAYSVSKDLDAITKIDVSAIGTDTDDKVYAKGDSTTDAKVLQDVIVVDVQSSGNNNTGLDPADSYVAGSIAEGFVVTTNHTPTNYEVAQLIQSHLAGTAGLDKVTYNGTDATITFVDGSTQTATVTVVSEAGAATAAKVMDTIQKAIENAASAADQPDSRAEITVVGNTMEVTTGSSETLGSSDPRDYFTDTSNNMSMHDLARFLGKLYTDGKATEIVYNSKTYEWDASKGGDSKSHWYNSSDDATLVAAIVAVNKPLIQAWATSTGAGCHDTDDLVLTIALTVNDAPMNIEMTIPKDVTP